LSKVVGISKWKQILSDCSFAIVVEENLSSQLIDEERKLVQTPNAVSGDKASTESEKTNLLLDLAEKEILGYFRLVAKREAG